MEDLEHGVVTEIADLAKKAAAVTIADLVQDVGGQPMSTVQLHHIPQRPWKKEAEPTPLTFGTLQALADYIVADRDEDVDLDKCVLHVASPGEVRLLGPIVGEARQRFCYAKAMCTDLGFGFLGPWHEQPNFVLGLLTRFEDSEARAALLKFVGSIRSDATVDGEDDGVSQTITARSGVHLGGPTKVPNPISLQPYRTFREVEQPGCLLIVRAQQADAEKGTVGRICLLEGDGGAWALQAVANIKEWLADVEGVPVLA